MMKTERGVIMSLLESGEMYLETVLVLSEKIKKVRSVDIADYRGFSKPSVSRAVSKLKNDGFINIDKDGYITLTEEGKAVAEKIYERHTLLTDFLIKLGVDEKTAVEDACKIEHDISDDTFGKIKKYIESIGL